jgi:CcmD family protein
MTRSLTFLFAGSLLVFIVLFVYLWLMISRQNKLDRKVDELKAYLKETARAKNGV